MEDGACAQVCIDATVGKMVQVYKCVQTRQQASYTETVNSSVLIS